jgi:predicted RNase H-like HicB family nuclease
MKYLVVIEQGTSSFGAYAPDLPGCIAVGETHEEVTTLIQEAIELHIEDLKAQGQQVPSPHSSSELVTVDA